jgi:hypothetical protein
MFYWYPVHVPYYSHFVKNKFHKFDCYLYSVHYILLGSVPIQKDPTVRLDPGPK